MDIACSSFYQGASFDFHVENPQQLFHLPNNELEPAN